MDADLRANIVDQIETLGAEIGVRVIILSPLSDAQRSASTIWREAISLRSSLRAANLPDLEAAARLLIDASSSCLAEIEAKLYVAPEFEPSDQP